MSNHTHAMTSTPLPRANGAHPFPGRNGAPALRCDGCGHRTAAADLAREIDGTATCPSCRRDRLRRRFEMATGHVTIQRIQHLCRHYHQHRLSGDLEFVLAQEHHLKLSPCRECRGREGGRAREEVGR